MKELNVNKYEEVNGGIIPVIAAGIALASHVGVGGASATVGAHLLTGASLALATYSLAEYLDE
jgi:hypothetical protein